jgi:hypothetical protein
MGIVFGRHVVRRQTENIQHMWAGRPLDEPMQVNSDDVVGLGAIERIWFEGEQAVDMDFVAELGSLWVQCEKDLAGGFGGRDDMKVVDDGVVVSAVVAGGVIVCMASRSRDKQSCTDSPNADYSKHDDVSKELWRPGFAVEDRQAAADDRECGDACAYYQQRPGVWFRYCGWREKHVGLRVRETGIQLDDFAERDRFQVND